MGCGGEEGIRKWGQMSRLPDEPGVSFLATVGEIVEEGNRMKHCIGLMAKRAVTGRSYFFHVNRAGEQASVEVRRAGRVVQVCGPMNRSNAATQWAAKVLRRWGSQFPAELPPLREVSNEDYEQPDEEGGFWQEGGLG